MSIRTVCLISIVVGVSCTARSVSAQQVAQASSRPVVQASGQTPLNSREDSVQSRIQQLEQQVQWLQEKTDSLDQGVRSAAVSPQDQFGKTEQASHTVYNPMPCDGMFGCPPKFPTVSITGFLQADTGWFGQNAANMATVGDIDDGNELRRARIGFKGNVTEDISYILEFDFAASIPLFVDTWMNFSHVPGLGNIRIGRWRQPFGMAELTSIRELPFLERPLIFTFSPFRQTGIGFYNHSEDERMTWALSGYRFPSDNFGNNVGDAGGWGLAGRMTFLPYYIDEGEQLLHLGLDYAYHNPSQNTVRFANTPEIQVAQSTGGLLTAPQFGVPLFVDTGVLTVNDTNHFGVEAATALSRLYLQSEFRWVVVQLANGSTATLPGGYAHARYVLTGEKLPYNKTGGAFGRIVPHEDFNFHGCWGAWELAARWSYIDLNGPGFPGPGRRLNDVTLGMNWYLNKYTKFQFNYIHAFLNDPTIGNSNCDIAAIRAQVDF